MCWRPPSKWLMLRLKRIIWCSSWRYFSLLTVTRCYSVRFDRADFSGPSACGKARFTSSAVMVSVCRSRVGMARCSSKKFGASTAARFSRLPPGLWRHPRHDPARTTNNTRDATRRSRRRRTGRIPARIAAALSEAAWCIVPPRLGADAERGSSARRTHRPRRDPLAKAEQVGREQRAGRRVSKFPCS